MLFVRSYISFSDVGDGDVAEPRADGVADQVCAAAYDDHALPNARPVERLELVVQHGLTLNAHQGFGAFVGEWTESRALSRCEDYCLHDVYLLAPPGAAERSARGSPAAIVRRTATSHSFSSVVREAMRKNLWSSPCFRLQSLTSTRCSSNRRAVTSAPLSSGRGAAEDVVAVGRIRVEEGDRPETLVEGLCRTGHGVHRTRRTRPRIAGCARGTSAQASSRSRWGARRAGERRGRRRRRRRSPAGAPARRRPSTCWLTMTRFGNSCMKLNALSCGQSGDAK